MMVLVNYIIQKVRFLFYIQFSFTQNILYYDKFSILKKKRIKSKFNLFSRHNDFGTDVIIITGGQTNLFNYSHQEVFDLVNQHPEIMTGITFYMSVHDFDWHAVCFFATDDILQEVIAYIKEKAQLVITDDYSHFS